MDTNAGHLWTNRLFLTERQFSQIKDREIALAVAYQSKVTAVRTSASVGANGRIWDSLASTLSPSAELIWQAHTQT